MRQFYESKVIESLPEESWSSFLLCNLVKNPWNKGYLTSLGKKLCVEIQRNDVKKRTNGRHY